MVWRRSSPSFCRESLRRTRGRLCAGLSLSVAGTYFHGAAARRAIGWTVGALASAAIVGVPIVAVISEAFGWRAAFFGAGVLAAGVAMMAARWLPHDSKHPDGGFWPASLTAVYAPLLHDHRMRRLFGASVLRAICWVGLLTYFGAYLSDEMGLSVGQDRARLYAGRGWIPPGKLARRRAA